MGTSGFFMTGRGMSTRVLPKYESNNEGFVVVEVHIDASGKTIFARSGIRGSTLSDAKVLEESRKAALNTTWTNPSNKKGKQVGYIIYNFRIK